MRVKQPRGRWGPILTHTDTPAAMFTSVDGKRIDLDRMLTGIGLAPTYFDDAPSHRKRGKAPTVKVA